MNPSRISCWLLLLALCGAGCEQLNLRSQSPDEEESVAAAEEFETEVRTPYVGDYAVIAGMDSIVLEGVGLVTGLDGTGEDPPVSVYRTALLEDMKKRGVRNPNLVLQSPSTALVVVRAYLPPLVREGDRFDVEVRLPENSEAKSLSGGWLMETRLSERAIVPGRGVMKGHVFAKAQGPVLISTGEGEDETAPGVLRRGKVLGGGVSLKSLDLSLYLRNEYRSVRNSQRIATRIGQRFHSYNQYGLKEPLAEAKTDQHIVLKVHPRYRDNYSRYLQVIRNIAFRETPVAQRVRMQRLQQRLLVPETSEKAALQLEAIGHEAIPILKTGLKSPLLEVRFHSAVALAYLEDSTGLPVLAEAAAKERAFRVYALAAMAVTDDAEAHVLLRELMNDQSAELKYGAFRALWTLDRNDPFIRGEVVNDEFALHVLDTKGDPMIHLTHRKRAEIVLFGADQTFRTPMAVRAGNHILVTSSPGSETITVSRYETGEEDLRRDVSNRVADVIRTAAEFGASYPDIAQMLVQAEKQYNVRGRIEIDALPQAGRVYYRPGPKQAQTRIGRTSLMPNMFPALETGGRRTTPPGREADVDRSESTETEGADAGIGFDGETDDRAPKAPTEEKNLLDFLKLGGKSDDDDDLL